MEKIPTSQGDCYYLRYRERFGEARGTRPRLRIGLVKDFPTKRALEEALHPLRARINSGPVEAPKTMADVIARYKLEEMPARHSTRRGYERMIRNYIEPRWKDEPLTSITAADARAWLRSLPVAPKTRGHIHGLMRVLFRFARFWLWIEGENPMQAFRMEGSNQRSREPRILTEAELHALVAKIENPLYQRMVLVAAATGLRRSELAGLKWANIDFMGGWIKLKQAVVEGRQGPLKTKASGKDIPLSQEAMALFTAIRSDSAYRDDTDWVFASARKDGKLPLDMNEIQASHIRPAAIAAGLGEHIGWHTFRHSFAAWIRAGGAEMTVQRDLLRHADIHTTMQIYGGINAAEMRKASEAVSGRILQ